MITWLDLFCGAGCVADGLRAAGDRVIGVDIEPRNAKYYPGPFHCMDVNDVELQVSSLADRRKGFKGEQVHAIWASPPCLEHTELNAPNSRKGSHPDLISLARAFCIRSGLPYVIENVPGAPLNSPVELRGAMFTGLDVDVNGTRFHLDRPRIFETNFPVRQPVNYFPDRSPIICAIGAHARNRSKAHGGRGTADFTDFQAPRGMRHRLLLGRAFGMPDHRKISCKGITDGIPPIYATYIAEALQTYMGIPNGRA